MNDSIREQVLQRVLRHGAVGIARNEISGAFYVNIEVVESSHEVFAEITFNPEYVVLENDNETDVYLVWGRWEDMSIEVSRFIQEIEFHPCPSEIEDRVRRVLFGEERMEAISPDFEDPWHRFERPSLNT